MVDPYSMFVVNIIASTLLGLGILTYTFIYPKKKINLVLLLILISLLPLISLLRKGTYESGQLNEHASAAYSFYGSLMEGIIRPVWLAKDCSGYGCPYFIFLYPLPYYIASFFHFLGFGFVSSMKLLLAVSFISSGVAMYFWARDELGKVAGFTAAVFYLYAPYHLSTMLYRVSIGEVLSFVFPPLILLWSKKIIATGKYQWIALNSLCLLLLILSHLVTFLVLMPFILGYISVCYIRQENKKIRNLMHFLLSIVFGVLIASYYWLPALSEGKYTQIGLFKKVLFQPFWYYFFSPFQYYFGLLFQGHNAELYTNVGYMPWLVLIISLVLFFKKRLNTSLKSLYLFLLLSFFAYFIMMQKITEPIWSANRFLLDIQFPWRLLVEISFIIAMIAGIAVKTVNKIWFTVLICFFATLITILNWGNRKTVPQTTELWLKDTTTVGEARCEVELSTPIWVNRCAPWIGKYPKDHLENIAGSADIRQIYRKSTKHSYVIDARTNVTLKENTYYYPGWIVFANDKSVPIIKNDRQYPGIITFNLPKGLYRIDVVFLRTIDRIVGDTVSSVSFLVLILFFLFQSGLNIIKSKKLKRTTN